MLYRYLTFNSVELPNSQSRGNETPEMDRFAGSVELLTPVGSNRTGSGAPDRGYLISTNRSRTSGVGTMHWAFLPKIAYRWLATAS